MTTEPKVVPNEAVEISLGDNTDFRVRMIDCVGYLVPEAEGHIKNGGNRRFFREKQGLCRLFFILMEKSLRFLFTLSKKCIIIERHKLLAAGLPAGAEPPCAAGPFFYSLRNLFL